MIKFYLDHKKTRKNVKKAVVFYFQAIFM